MGASSVAEKEGAALADVVEQLEAKLAIANALAKDAVTMQVAAAGGDAAAIAAAVAGKQAEINRLTAQLRDNTANTARVIADVQVTVSALEARVIGSNAEAQNAVESLGAERDALAYDLAAALDAAAKGDDKIAALSQTAERAEAAAEAYVREIAFLKELNGELEKRAAGDVSEVEAAVAELRASLLSAEQERFNAVEALCI